jgi:Myb-like DNA-binding domain
MWFQRIEEVIDDSADLSTEIRGTCSATEDMRPNNQASKKRKRTANSGGEEEEEDMKAFQRVRLLTKSRRDPLVLTVDEARLTNLHQTAGHLSSTPGAGFFGVSESSSPAQASIYSRVLISSLLTTDNYSSESSLGCAARIERHVASHRRGPWSQAEDNYLIQLVHTQGGLNWVRVAQLIGSRSPKQCRERYHCNLKPSLNHQPISPEEGLLIERLVAEMGKQWAEVARRLDGRSDNAVKNWWNGSMNRRRRITVRRRAASPCLH